VLKQIKIHYRQETNVKQMFKEMKKQNKMQAIFCSAVKPMKHLEISL